MITLKLKCPSTVDDSHEQNGGLILNKREYFVYELSVKTALFYASL
jgi:hypothetical protein